MKVPSCFRLTVAVCCLLGGGPVRTAPVSANPLQPLPLPPGASPSLCEQAGTAAEQAHGLPAGLLLAIGRVESGRWDATRDRQVPWPWTINAAGKGRHLDSKPEAIRAVALLRAQGTRSIDVGCFQINLMFHPGAFTSLDEAFAPRSNALYAAKYLTELRQRTGSWEGAIGAYHSATPGIGDAYRARVLAAWSGASARAAPGIVAASAPFPSPARPAAPTMAIWSVASQSMGMRVWTMSDPRSPRPVVTPVALPRTPTSRR